VTGLIKPSQGAISVLGLTRSNQSILSQVGYCNQFDSFPRAEWYDFIYCRCVFTGLQADQAKKLTTKPRARRMAASGATQSRGLQKGCASAFA